MRKLLAVALATLTLSFATTAHADDCEIVISEPNWSSGQFMAYLDKFVAETVYGCEAELMPNCKYCYCNKYDRKRHTKHCRRIY